MNDIRYEYHLKISTEDFYLVLKRYKNFEVRKNDRDFKLDGILYLEEFDNHVNKYTGSWCERRIKYILDDEKYCKEGYVILGF